MNWPYRGGAPAVADTVAGQTQLMFTAGTQSLEHVKAGKLRLLAVTEGKRSSLLPDIPTVGETLPCFEMAVWYGAYGPAGMSKEIVARLNAEIGRTATALLPGSGRVRSGISATLSVCSFRYSRRRSLPL
jgi:tripartite-type tricarboxylate transporter receptor subunit TctC